MVSLLALAASVFFTPLLVAEEVAGESTVGSVLLTDGAEVTGRILLEQSDRLVVDIGFTVVTIPRSAILEVKRDGSAEAVTNDPYGAGDIFRTLEKTVLLPVKDWVDRHGEAVVLVRTGSGLGSGFVIHSSGYVVTNDHVIAGEREISVTVFETEGDSELKKTNYDNVRIVASSTELDLALLKIETSSSEKFVTAPIGDAGVLRQGQTVFAIGSPLGLERSVSQGIVSVRNRPIDGRLYIQTTAEINPGNSGGPLFNLAGEVIGVNNMKIVAAGAEGLGFAISADTLKMFLRNRDAFAFDSRNPNAGFRYNAPPLAENGASAAE